MLKKARALIITGDAVYDNEEPNHFAPVGQYFAGYLSAGAEVKDIHIVSAQNWDDQSLLQLIRHYTRRTHYPFLLSYHGHGSKLGWRINHRHRLEYEQLAPILAESKVPVQTLVDCCHAFAVVKPLIQHRAKCKQVGVIAACTEEQTTRGNEFVNAVVDCWKKQQFYPRSFVVPVRSKEIFTEDDIQHWRGPSRTEVLETRTNRVRWGLRLDKTFFADP